jgi:hypothetical protein
MKIASLYDEKTEEFDIVVINGTYKGVIQE